MPCMHTYASTRARTYAQRKRRKEMWRRRMTEAHHSHPPRNVRTYVRTYVPTYARTCARTYVHLDACARMPCMRMRTYAQRNRRKEMWRRRMTEAHHSHPPPTHARTYARCTYVRTYFRYAPCPQRCTCWAGRAGLADRQSALAWSPGRKNAEILPSLTHPHVHGDAHNTFPFGAPTNQ